MCHEQEGLSLGLRSGAAVRIGGLRFVRSVASGGDATTAVSATQPSFPVTIDAANGPVTIAQRPTDIVSLSPTATEMLFAIGAGEQVKAVDDFSTYPADAPVTDLSGFEPNLEAIASFEPDLVVLANDTGDVVKGLERLDIAVLLEPAAVTIDDSYEQIEQLGQATGNPEDAEALVASMRSDIDALLTDAPDGSGLSVYHELDDTYYSATSDTFIGQVYDMFGVSNIADEAKGAASGYPQLSSEYIVDADPSLIVLVDGACCGQSPKTVAKRPGWDGLTALRNDAVIEIDDDIASRWGPRIVEFMQAVADGLNEASAT